MSTTLTTGPDTFVYVNAILMLVISALFIKDLVLLYAFERTNREQDERLKTVTLIIQGVLGIAVFKKSDTFIEPLIG